MTFLGPRRLGAPPWHHMFQKAMIIFIKQFWKAAKKLLKKLALLSAAF
jgi:hypothetical protein